MPELPDVEVFRQYVDATSLHQTVARVTVGNRRVLHRITTRGLDDGLRGSTFESTHRHGKNLFVRTSRDQDVLLHFGMTGLLKYTRSRDFSHDHVRVTFHFRGGGTLYYLCQRLLGKVSLVDSWKDYVERQKLGPDALEVDKDTFVWILRSHRSSIKSLLMNQDHLAGLGNIYADEILFQSHIHPRARSDRLGEQRIVEVYRIMRKVLRRAIERQADPDRLPSSYLLPHRSKGQACPRCGTPLEHATVGGRTSYYCPSCQS